MSDSTLRSSLMRGSKPGSLLSNPFFSTSANVPMIWVASLFKDTYWHINILCYWKRKRNVLKKIKETINQRNTERWRELFFNYRGGGRGYKSGSFQIIRLEEFSVVENMQKKASGFVHLQLIFKEKISIISFWVVQNYEIASSSRNIFWHT